MCGFVVSVGDISLSYREQLRGSLELLEHRGPDAAGMVRRGELFVGHRRLSILDVSERSSQPMEDMESGTVLAYNGELYNYKSLRRKLSSLGHRFISQGDTEVVLRAIVEWGEDAFQKFNGMWALAAWLPRERRLLLSRDRFGIKPLYYSVGGAGLVVASEPKSIVHLCWERRAVDVRTLADFLGEGRIHHSSRTFYEDVRSLLPAHYAVYRPDSGCLQVRRFWDYPSESDGWEPEGSADVWEEFEEIFADAVRLRLQSDVPVGFTVSGGADSSAIVAAAVRAGHDVGRCFTASYGDGSEGEGAFAREVVGSVDGVSVEVVAPEDEWIPTMRRIAWHMDSPSLSPAVFPLWCIMREVAASGVRVVLEGQGADEELAGYPNYAAYAIAEALLRALRLQSPREWSEGVWDLVKAALRGFGWRVMLPWTARAMLPHLVVPYRQRVGALQAMRPGLRDLSVRRRASTLGACGRVTPSDRLSCLGRRLRGDHSSNVLPGLLQYGDSASMAHSVESRLPFLDHRLVELCFECVPMSFFRDGDTKAPIRQFLRSSGMAEVADRRRKLGFPTPVAQWLRGLGRGYLEDLLASPTSLLYEFCEPNSLRRLIGQHLRGVPGTANHLYRLLTLELWLEECMMN